MEIDIKKLMTAIIGAAVGLIILASLLVPILDMYTQTTDTYTNEGIIFMNKIDDSSNITLVWDHTQPNVITVNNVSMVMPQGLPINLTVSGQDDFFIRYSDTAVTVFHNGSTTINASVSASTDMTVTITGGSVTATDGTNTATFTLSGDLFIVSKTGDYVMKNADETVKVLSDSEIHSYGRTYLAGNIQQWCNFNIDGSIEDGFVIDSWDNTVSITDYTITAPRDTSHVDLYDFSKIEFTASKGGDTYDCIYSQVIVPYQVTAEKADHFSPTEIDLLNLAPTLLIIAIAIGLLIPLLRNRE